MTAYFKMTTLINRPVSDLFDFHARNHVRNHNRWDPDIELQLNEEAPLKVGTIIQRRNTRSGVLVEGTMEVLAFEPDRIFEVIIHDGPQIIRGRTLYEAVSDRQSSLTVMLELPDMDDSMDKTFLNSRLERTGQNIKRLVEAEYPE